MHIGEFRSIISSFADPGAELLYERSRVIFSVNGELIEIELTTKDGDVLVSDGSTPIPASTWILKRLAKLPLLATRMKEAVGEQNLFVPPAANLLPSLAVRPDETLTSTDNALDTTLTFLGERSPLETSVLYIISDAGEGKTFLINQMAKEQAQRYLDGTADWLLVPIPLGGKHFLRFDDITVGALQNRYRFPFLYYDSFLALVRMGVIVPAFDGFEEMFVESSSGEALSAMGMLVSALDSRGALVIAARKAYFEFESLKTQEKLFDTIRSFSVGFGKLELLRWAKPQFTAYCSKREVLYPEKIYQRVSERLGADHSLLTRPVLVRRLVDIAAQSPSLDAFLERIHASGQDFFAVFIRGIIEREATEKWIDRSGEQDVGTPLLSVDEHSELLALLALATWEARVDFLKRDNLEFVTDYFSEVRRKTAFQSRQIRERIRGHALLIPSPNSSNAVEFDHEEFRLFFLGEGLAEQMRPLNDKARGEVLAILRRAVIPKHAQLAFIRAINRDAQFERLQAVRFLLGISALDGQSSYTHENCAWLILRLLSDLDAKSLEIAGLAFPPNALRHRKLENITFRNCFFASSSMELSSFNCCTFVKCHFGQIRIHRSTVFKAVSFEESAVDAIRLVDQDSEFWEPATVQDQLERLGVQFRNAQPLDAPVALSTTSDQELRDFEKLIRYFMRSTHVSEGVILMKLGNRAQCFIDNVLPELLSRQVMVAIDNRGGGVQRRFKLGKTLEEIDEAIATAQGSYAEFLNSF